MTGANRVNPGRERPQLARVSVAPVRLRRDVHHPLSPLPVPRLSAVIARQGLAWPTPARPIGATADSALDPLRAPDHQDSTEKELRNSQENDMDPQITERAIMRCIDISVRLGALEDGVPPAADRVIVQCVDEIDEMQRWLEGRE